MRPSSSTRPRIRFSPISTPIDPASGFQAQLFFTLARHRQQTSLRQSDLFAQLTICDYLFERDKVYAYLNLDDNELFIYQRLYELLAADIPVPGSRDLPPGARPMSSAGGFASARARAATCRCPTTTTSAS